MITAIMLYACVNKIGASFFNKEGNMKKDSASKLRVFLIHPILNFILNIIGVLALPLIAAIVCLLFPNIMNNISFERFTIYLIIGMVFVYGFAYLVYYKIRKKGMKTHRGRFPVCFH